MTELEDRIFHLEVMTGLREPYKETVPLNDGSAYSAATIYFNSFVKALATVPACHVCGRYHEEFGYDS